MTSGIQTLSEKEKQTLRLLVDGHDAKSMARHLGLSVHTINERLRDARRKMAVSSSREAARQLRAIENHDPEMLGDKALGEAAAAPDMKELAMPAEARRRVRPSGWIAGGVFMSFSLALLAFASMSGSADTSAAPPSAVSAESAAVAAARDWLALVDRGDWNASWEAMGQSFNALNTDETWARVAQVQGRLGAMKSRALVSEETVPAPPYGYQVIKFRTDYANKAGATETLSLVREGGSWRVVGVTVE